MLKVLFVCDTNTSLSPLALAIFEKLLVDRGLEGKIGADSAGSHPGKTPRPADFRVRKLIAEKQLLVTREMSRALSEEDLLRSDLLLVMNEENFWHIKNLLPTVDGNKLKLLMEYTKQLGIREMPDPLLGEIEFDQAFEWLEKATLGLIESLISSHNLKSR